MSANEIDSIKESSIDLPNMKVPNIPNTTLTIEAKPWPKGHVARIASLRKGSMSPVARKKIQSATIAR